MSDYPVPPELLEDPEALATRAREAVFSAPETARKRQYLFQRSHKQRLEHNCLSAEESDGTHTR